jgi:hypothetical protein
MARAPCSTNLSRIRSTVRLEIPKVSLICLFRHANLRQILVKPEHVSVFERLLFLCEQDLLIRSVSVNFTMYFFFI